MKFLLAAIVLCLALLALVIIRRRKPRPMTGRGREHVRYREQAKKGQKGRARHEGYMFTPGIKACDKALQKGRKWKKARSTVMEAPLPGCQHPDQCDCRVELVPDQRLGDRRMAKDRRGPARFEAGRRDQPERRKGAKPWDDIQR